MQCIKRVEYGKEWQVIIVTRIRSNNFRVNLIRCDGGVQLWNEYTDPEMTVNQKAEVLAIHIENIIERGAEIPVKIVTIL